MKKSKKIEIINNIKLYLIGWQIYTNKCYIGYSYEMKIFFEGGEVIKINWIAFVY